MQKLELDQYPNSSGWQIVHLINDQLYEIQNKHGTPLRIGCFTNRRFAEQQLAKYLEKINAVQVEIVEKKSRKRKLQLKNVNTEVKT